MAGSRPYKSKLEANSGTPLRDMDVFITRLKADSCSFLWNICFLVHLGYLIVIHSKKKKRFLEGKNTLRTIISWLHQYIISDTDFELNSSFQLYYIIMLELSFYIKSTCEKTMFLDGTQ